MLFLTIVALIILAGAEVDLFVPSFPELMQTFNLTPFEVQLTLSSNFISQCLASVYVGTLGDSFGRRKMILYGVLVFIAGSVFCAFATTFPMIVIGRILQGLGIAAPAVLGYVVVADNIPLEKQAGALGILNGMITVAMAAAPVVGSFVSMAYGWRGNFMAFLIMGLVALCMALAFLPPDKITEGKPSFSLKDYVPLLKCGRYIRILTFLSLFTTCFWTFIGMSPILYMNDLGVPIERFGFYQGTICATFATISLLSPKIMNYFGQHRCYRVSIYNVLVMGILVLLTAIFIKDNPIIITVLITLLMVWCVFPINILYPLSLDFVEGSKGRASALYNVVRLIVASFGVELMGYLYNGTFLPLAFYISTCVGIGVFLAFRTAEWKKIEFNPSSQAPMGH